MPQLSSRRERSRLVLAVAVPAVIAAAAVAAGALLGGRAPVAASFAVVLCASAPFFIRFEQRRPQARELALLAVLCALAVAARAAFVWVPHFKPMAGIIMIAGMALGPASGFMVGSVAALVSNFVFGQGPWTPWQMLAMGLCGLVFGFIGRRFVRPGRHLGWGARGALAIAGGLFIVLAAGPVLDTSSLFLMVSRLTPEAAAAVYLAGFPVNCMHGAATAATLFLLADPLLSRLSRVCRKYGMLGR